MREYYRASLQFRLGDAGSDPKEEAENFLSELSLIVP
jgi:hypothetical protein